MIRQISWVGSAFGGIAVPGTPSRIVRNSSASDPPWLHDPVVKSGPRMPPFPATPWQKTHSCRNSTAPCVTAALSPVNGLVDDGWAACADNRGAAAANAIRRTAGARHMLLRMSHHAERD